MEFHPVADIFPMMPEAELKDLAADIEANGLIESIWTYRGKIVDGRNRYRACLMVGEQPRYQEWRGDESDLVGFVLSLNLKRRHLDASQRAVIGLAVERYEAERAKERQGARNDIVEIIPQSDTGRARDFAAVAVDVNPRYIQEAKRIEATAPDLIPQIAAGEMTIPEAKREIRRRERAVIPEITAPTPAHCDIRHCSAAQLFASGVKPDVVITDPPYPREYLPLYAELAQQCAGIRTVAVMCGLFVTPKGVTP